MKLPYRPTFSILCLLSSVICLMLSAQTITPVATDKLISTVYNWEKLPVIPTAKGLRRDVFDGPTTTLDKVHCHITTLNPNTTSHPPHTHPNEEMVIVKEGKLQAHVNGKEIVVNAGGVLFYASMQPHGVRNIGDTSATYYVINWASPGSKTKKIPPTPAPPTAQ